MTEVQLFLSYSLGLAFIPLPQSRMSFTSQLPPPKHDHHTNNDKPTKTAGLSTDILGLLTLNETKLSTSEKNGHDAVDTTLVAKPHVNIDVQDLIPLRQRNFNLEIPLPTAQEIKETKERTSNYFNRLMSNLLSKQTIANRQPNEQAGETLTISGRRVKISVANVDPLQPAKFKRASKIYTPDMGDDSARTQPLLHPGNGANSDKLSAEERAKWRIPTFVSQWKNPGGFTVSRSNIGDGSGNRKAGEGGDIPEINTKFIELSDALDKANDEAKVRLQMKYEARKIKLEEGVKLREEKIRALATRRRNYKVAKRYSSNNGRSSYARGGKEEQTGEANSNGVLVERLRELAHREGREVSEKVLLGTAKATKQPELNYDSRLFVKGARLPAKRPEDQVYDNPLFVQQDIDTIYRTNYSKFNNISKKANNEELDEGDLMDKVNRETGRDAAGSKDHAGPIQFTEAGG